MTENAITVGGALAHHWRVTPPPPVGPVNWKAADDLMEGDPDYWPDSQAQWALLWASYGFRIFPCERFLGRPLVSRWFREATSNEGHIIEWWSEHPNADIAALPDAAHAFVVSPIGAEGRDSLCQVEAGLGDLQPLLTIPTPYGGHHYWMPGRAATTHHLGGRAGLHCYGLASYIYMPGSAAPDPINAFV